MVKCPGVIGWKANVRPPGWKVRENAPLLPGGGDGHYWNWLMHNVTWWMRRWTKRKKHYWINKREKPRGSHQDCALSLSTFGFTLQDRDVSLGRILEDLSIFWLRRNNCSAEFKVVGSWRKRKTKETGISTDWVLEIPAWTRREICLKKWALLIYP